jgi:sugar lactone lactonase YvrE
VKSKFSIMRQLFTLAILFTTSFLSAQSYNGPESAEYDPITGDYYVSNTGSRQIIKRNPAGVLTVFKTLTNAPYGLELVGRTLYACSSARVIGYDVNTGNEVLNINTNGTFLNGITADAAGDLYATDFSARKIFKFYPQRNTYTTFVASTVNQPNGIVYDGTNNRLVFAGWGANALIKGVSLVDSTVTLLKTTTFSNIDGIVHDGNGKFFVASWSADAVHSFESNFTVGPTLVQGSILNPADIDYNENGDTLAVTSTTSNTLILIPMSTGVAVENAHSEVLFLTCFPNPAVNSLYIPFEDKSNATLQIEIFDFNGQHIVCPFAYQEEMIKLDISALAKGNYFGKINGSLVRFTKN